MRQYWSGASFMLLTFVVLAGCTKEEGPLYVPEPTPPGEPVDSAFFSTEVLPIFTAHCWTCHPDMANLDLSAVGAYASLVGVTSNNYAPSLRVTPGDPMASVLWHKISGLGTYGLTMPPSGATLSAAELQTIRDWIEQGARDN
ncbi:MAG: hypothetical protein JNM31_15060 [Flavobacteriales bacterium]|nr:hypothetical protein [Flavobacteriales bacterium]